ncbi:hypothetical protein CPB83DRAFT_775661 [Crepidotus variabilis]|uniref:F-box domain-containing protein n=1 Tax=Crepidotus variabilis TaxID=179855 RepID=A0A9P6E6C6_9AGAR|nr:hypothetical protein CPB83DRAFT_775661 [Crepidotus variabilis]
MESEDEIRCPSGLGSAVSLTSNRSLPPSPFTPIEPPFGVAPQPAFQRTRAISSPNLLRSLSLKVRGKARGRAESNAQKIANPPRTQSPSVLLPPATPPKDVFNLPENILLRVLSHLSAPAVASCATVSRSFAIAARSSLYGMIDTTSISLSQLETVIAVLASRTDLAELVTTFICPHWPPFFLSNTKTRTSHMTQHKDALLTATFTLALERMLNLTTLTLPAFDVSLLAQHTAFGLRSITFLNDSFTEPEMKALFTWLDGQINITSLRFPYLLDPQKESHPLIVRTNLPVDSSSSGKTSVSKRPQTAPDSPFLKVFPTTPSPYTTPIPSPSSALFNDTSIYQEVFPFTSSTLLPNLATLHATPSLVTSLSVPLDNGSTSIRRPLELVTLNINSTLYTGLRPAALMSSLKGISQLGLVFSTNVDKRSFEKVLGAAGAALGSATEVEVIDDPFVDRISKPPSCGLRGLAISFHISGTHSDQEEMLYRSLQAALPRYKHLSTLRLSIYSDQYPVPHQRTPSTSEDALIRSWLKFCPTLTSVALSSGAEWQF